MTATGTITCKISPLGWEKTYSETNKAVYRSLDPSSNQLYLRVDDTNAQYSAVNIYETMSNVDTGTGASTTKYWKKSTTSDTVVKPWYAIGNKKVFYLFSDWHPTYPLQPAGYCFGWFPSFKSGDGYNTMLIGHDISTPASPAVNNDFASFLSTNTDGLLIARSYSQLGSAITFYKLPGIGNHTSMGYDPLFTYPNQVDNGIHLFPVYIYETSHAFRGRVAGIYTPNEHTAGSFYSRDKTVKVDGKRYIAYRISNSISPGQIGNCWFPLDEEWT